MRPRLIGFTMLVTVALLWQLFGCATPTADRQITSQVVEPPSQITLQWEPSTTKTDGTALTDILGYKIHYGQRSRTYAFTKFVGNQTSAAVSGLVPGRIYFFALTAYDSAGNQSELSGEVSMVVPTTTSETPTLMQEALRRGHAAEIWVTGAQPAEVVSFLHSQAGEGEGPCSPQLGGLCIDLLDPSVFGEATVNDSGIAILRYTTPTDVALGQMMSVQAVIQRGPDGADSVKTNVITSTVTD
jgi:hypothetical protein